MDNRATYVSRKRTVSLRHIVVEKFYRQAKRNIVRRNTSSKLSLRRFPGFTLPELILTVLLGLFVIVGVVAAVLINQREQALNTDAYQAGYVDGISYVIERGITGEIRCFVQESPRTEGFLAGERYAEQRLISAGCKPNYQMSEVEIAWTPADRLEVILTAIRIDANVDQPTIEQLQQRFASVPQP